VDDRIDTLLVEVRAGTDGFLQDIERMRAGVEGGLAAGLGRAGASLERGLSGAIRKGTLDLEDLRRIALETLDAIAARALGGLGGSGLAAGGLGGFDAAGAVGALLGLPGRATGGNVSPGRGYVVGERGPEVFVPTSAGRIEPGPASRRDVRVSINLAAPVGASAPRSFQRSSRQIASAVRRALADR